jgi:hypothetical protein
MPESYSLFLEYAQAYEMAQFDHDYIDFVRVFYIASGTKQIGSVLPDPENWDRYFEYWHKMDKLKENKPRDGIKLSQISQSIVWYMINMINTPPYTI